MVPFLLRLRQGFLRISMVNVVLVLSLLIGFGFKFIEIMWSVECGAFVNVFPEHRTSNIEHRSVRNHR